MMPTHVLILVISQCYYVTNLHTYKSSNSVRKAPSYTHIARCIQWRSQEWKAGGLVTLLLLYSLFSFINGLQNFRGGSIEFWEVGGLEPP